MEEIREACAEKEERAKEEELQELYEKFLNEKKQFQEEMKLLRQQMQDEDKRLRDKELFFEKKMQILMSGFTQLEADKKAVEKERKRLNAERELLLERDTEGEEEARMFFRGVSNPLTLKKRYKDLIKIFHPDNLCGDTDTIQKINKVYEVLQEEIEWQKKA